MLDLNRLSGTYDVRRMTEDDAEDILAFCRKNAEYYRYCSAEATMEQVRNDLRSAPPGVGPEDKYYVGFFKEGTLTALLDLADGYPQPDRAFIGFFMMNADLQGQQIGTGIISDVCAHLKETGKTAVRLAYAKDNPQAGHFWRKNGFDTVGIAPMGTWTATIAEKKL